jgi:hypothetical protein
LNRKLNFVVAIVAGFLGSTILQYAFGQSQPAVTKEVRAQSFVLVDPANNVVGTFASEPIPNTVTLVVPGAAPKLPYHVVLRDPAGRVIWSPENPTKLVPLSSR